MVILELTGTSDHKQNIRVTLRQPPKLESIYCGMSPWVQNQHKWITVDLDSIDSTAYHLTWHGCRSRARKGRPSSAVLETATWRSSTISFQKTTKWPLSDQDLWGDFCCLYRFSIYFQVHYHFSNGYEYENNYN